MVRKTQRERVLVTGATGFIGHELAKLLAEQGYRPRLMIRRPERAALLRPLAADLVGGDLTSAASLERAVEGIDTVFHLGARATFESYRRLKPTIVDGSIELMQAAIDAGARSFIYSSSLLVYDDQSDPIDSDTAAVPRIDYGRAKLEAEQRLKRMADAAGIQFAAIRLPHVYGAQDLIFDQLHEGWVVQIGGGRNLYSHLHVTDAARLLLAVAEKQWSGISPVGDERPADWREFFATAYQHFPRFRRMKVPTWLARLGTELLRPLQALHRRPTMMTPDTVVGWNLELPVQPGLLWNELGLRPRYASISEGIPAALDDCLSFRWRHPLNDRSRY